MGKLYIHSRGPNANRLDLIPEPTRSRVIEICRAVCAEQGHIDIPACVDKNHACYRCQDLALRALQAQGRAE